MTRRRIDWAVVLGVLLGATAVAAVAWAIVVDPGCRTTDPDRGCWPCLDAADWHASQWAFAEDNASKAHHQERRDHWLQAHAMDADCSGWRETVVAT